MQRGRDHGLPLYGEWRVISEALCGTNGTVVNLGYDQTSSYITDQDAIDGLEDLYGDVANADIWIAGLLEETIQDGRVGPTFQCLLTEQFQRLKLGDRFYFENYYQNQNNKLNSINQFSLSTLICLTTGINRVPENAFRQQAPGAFESCDQIVDLNFLAQWRENTILNDNCGIPNSPQNG